MSFLDGIVNVARSVIGLPPAHAEAKKAAPAREPERSKNLAVDTPTGFDRGVERARATVERRLTTPTLSDRLRTAETTSVAPHESAAATTEPVPSTQETPAAAASQSYGSIAAAPRAMASVSDATSGRALGTADTLSGRDEASTAARNVQAGLDYYASTFGRQGVDGAGSGVSVLVNDRSTDSSGKERFAGNGGYYATPQSDGSVTEAIHFGTGKSYDAANGRVEQASMQYADDLAIHELTHGIIRKESGHLGGDADEAGATNEGVADVMAAAATRDWSIGEGMYGAGSDYKRMRNIANPTDTTAVHGLWTSMDEVNQAKASGKELEEHWASGVVSTAAYRVQQRVGGEQGWQAVERVFYDTIDNNRMGDMSFESVASALRTSAASVYGQGSSVATAFDEELRRAGL